MISLPSGGGSSALLSRRTWEMPDCLRWGIMESRGYTAKEQPRSASICARASDDKFLDYRLTAALARSCLKSRWRRIAICQSLVNSWPCMYRLQCSFEQNCVTVVALGVFGLVRFELCEWPVFQNTFYSVISETVQEWYIRIGIWINNRYLAAWFTNENNITKWATPLIFKMRSILALPYKKALSQNPPRFEKALSRTTVEEGVFSCQDIFCFYIFTIFFLS